MATQIPQTVQEAKNEMQRRSDVMNTIRREFEALTEAIQYERILDDENDLCTGWIIERNRLYSKWSYQNSQWRKAMNRLNELEVW